MKQHGHFQCVSKQILVGGNQFLCFAVTQNPKGEPFGKFSEKKLISLFKVSKNQKKFTDSKNV